MQTTDRVVAALSRCRDARITADVSIECAYDEHAAGCVTSTIRVGVDGCFSFHDNFADAVSDLERRITKTITERNLVDHTVALHRAALLDPSRAPASTFISVPTWDELVQAAHDVRVLRTIDEMTEQHAKVSRK